ncbi:MAG TPA: sodium-dependent transporter [Candidatus Omnitrophota bacterium]|nr:sodium-dependent transporter [Candidatus Omnitrophota bacterium]
MERREHWSSRIGIIMAVAGSAIGLGNFLRFPAKVVDNGGGAFMIPYFISLLLLGIPLMWIEWTLGRYGGAEGSGTAPSIFHRIAPKMRFIKYFGILGILAPLLIFSYYTYIESWTLAYSFFSITGQITSITDQLEMKNFLKGFQGLEQNQYFNGMGTSYVFFLVTFAANVYILNGGIKAGIEKFCKWAMPILFIFAFALFFRVVTLGGFHSPEYTWTVQEGFGFFWNPQYSSLRSAKVWLEAAGQVFFTLSVGTGVILCYASYLSKKHDIALSGISAASANEFAEVILGGSILIPAAFVFFGPTEMATIVKEGIFNLGFVTMPLVLNHLPFPAFLGFLWFFLLFLAAVTSSVSLAQPFITFLEDEFHLARKEAVWIFAIVTFIICQPAVLFLKNGVIDELDFWGGSFFLVVFATVETIMFGWVLGIDNAWKELHAGADIKIPNFYKYIMKYVTPLFLLAILVMWLWQEWLPILLFQNIEEANRPYIITTRVGILLSIALLVILVRIAWQRKTEGKK